MVRKIPRDHRFTIRWLRTAPRPCPTTRSKYYYRQDTALNISHIPPNLSCRPNQRAFLSKQIQVECLVTFPLSGFWCNPVSRLWLALRLLDLSWLDNATKFLGREQTWPSEGGHSSCSFDASVRGLTILDASACGLTCGVFDGATGAASSWEVAWWTGMVTISLLHQRMMTAALHPSWSEQYHYLKYSSLLFFGSFALWNTCRRASLSLTVEELRESHLFWFGLRVRLYGTYHVVGSIEELSFLRDKTPLRQEWRIFCMCVYDM